MNFSFIFKKLIQTNRQTTNAIISLMIDLMKFYDLIWSDVTLMVLMILLLMDKYPFRLICTN